MASIFSILLASLLTLSSLLTPSTAAPPKLVKGQTLLLKYHRGPLLHGRITLNLIWYGGFTPIQRSIIVDFVRSLSRAAPKHPSVSAWWKIAESYGGKPCTVAVGKQIFDRRHSLGKFLKSRHLVALASNPKLNHKNSITVVLTARDVAVERFCMSRCGTHGHGREGRRGGGAFVYAWVGDSESQCPGQCAWPFHRPIYGPQTPPLVAPNGDVGVDGMVINLATVLAGAATNPFGRGFFQGPADAPLEAVSACAGAFGRGAYPGNPGRVLVDRVTRASYNAHGVNGRKYLLPAMWDPKTSTCKTLV